MQLAETEGFPRLGLQAFDRLQAQEESAWLEHAFVEPMDFEAMAGRRPAVIFGEGGAGKTALRLMLAKRACEPVEGQPCLVVDWQPKLIEGNPITIQAVQQCMSHVFEACAATLFRYVGEHPQVWQGLTPTQQETMTWFLHAYLSDRWVQLLRRWEGDLSEEGTALLHDIRTQTPEPILLPDAPPSVVIAELVFLLHKLRFAGVWIVMDGVEPWLIADAERITGTIRALLSTLTLFEDSGFVWKLLLPIELKRALAGVSGIDRRKLDVYHLSFNHEKLIELAEKRLSLACGREGLRLNDLIEESAKLIEWLKEYGGDLPKGWLDLLRPFVGTFLGQGGERPLAYVEWQRIQEMHSPKLRVDLAAERVFLGYREKLLASSSYKWLSYLYRQQPNMCSRVELYHRVYLGEEGAPASVRGQAPKLLPEHSTIVDTAIWRLREAIEPDPRNPIYVVTVRGKGMKLQNAA